MELPLWVNIVGLVVAVALVGGGFYWSKVNKKNKK